MPTSIAPLILKRFFTKLWNHLKKILVLKKTNTQNKPGWTERLHNYSTYLLIFFVKLPTC